RPALFARPGPFARPALFARPGPFVRPGPFARPDPFIGQRERGQVQRGDRAGRPDPDGDALPAAEQAQPGGGEDLRPELAYGAVVEEHAPRPARRVKPPHRPLHWAALCRANADSMITDTFRRIRGCRVTVPLAWLVGSGSGGRWCGCRLGLLMSGRGWV